MVTQPATSLLNLSAELRNRIYELVLVRPNPFIRPRFRPATRSRRLLAESRNNSGLLATNRMIHAESSPVFYGQNTFELVPVYKYSHIKACGEVLNFLTNLGRNATLIRELTIACPSIGCNMAGVLNVPVPYTNVLSAIRDKCTNLDVIKFGPTRGFIIAPWMLLSSTKTEVYVQALAAINTNLRAIPSLTTIAISLSGDACTYEQEMKKLGWKVMIGS